MFHLNEEKWVFVEATHDPWENVVTILETLPVKIGILNEQSIKLQQWTST